MKPLIKWPGGKSTELKQFLPLIPDYDRYIEPFVGGGALYFHLNPERALINDLSEHLMRFYEMVKAQDPEFRRMVEMYSRSFDALKVLCGKQYEQLLTLYRLYQHALTQKLDVKALRIARTLSYAIASDPSVCTELVPDREEFAARLEEAVEDKFLRTAKNEQKKPFSAKDLKANLITGFTSGYYLYFRDVMNHIAAGRLVCSPQYESANFFFVREFCYGSMFRYNREGEFNIPYGGVSYNEKDFAAKAAALFSADAAHLLERTQLCCEDFEKLMKGLDLTQRDFLFLDPPYDTEFSDYEGKPFDHEDQARLAAFLKTTKARFVLVIKNTEYIYSLYEDAQFRILAFENKYLYNVRRRNERRAEHLIITNIQEDEVPWIRENVEVK